MDKIYFPIEPIYKRIRNEEKRQVELIKLKQQKQKDDAVTKIDTKDLDKKKH